MNRGEATALQADGIRVEELMRTAGGATDRASTFAQRTGTTTNVARRICLNGWA